jgi:hypothetical protein
MTDVIRNLLSAEPFKPFVMKSSDGWPYAVKHPDYVAIGPKAGDSSFTPTRSTLPC